MSTTVSIDLRHVLRGLEVPLEQVQAVVELLDEGNTVPFITRYRKDRTGGLDEEQIREIQSRLVKLRLLAERKQTILRSIEAQGKLTEKLGKQIQGANTTKRLEDLYLPYKPKKQTLATLARTRGLEPLAREILDADPAAQDLDRRAAEFISVDKRVPTGAEALLGAGHILAEQISERAELRQRLRDILQRSGKLITTQVGADAKPTEADVRPAEGGKTAGEGKQAHERASRPRANSERQLSLPAMGHPPEDAPSPAPSQAAVPPEPASEPVEPSRPAEPTLGVVRPLPSQLTLFPVAEEWTSEPPVAEAPVEEIPVDEAPVDEAPVDEIPVDEVPVDESLSGEELLLGEPGELDSGDPMLEAEADEESVETETAAEEAEEEGSTETEDATETEVATEAEVAETPAAASAPAAGQRASGGKAKSSKAQRKAEEKKRKEQQRQKAFADYFSYQEEIKKIPPHRILAINRGERAKVLRVKIEADMEAMHQAIEELVIPPGHPHADLLRGCARNALARLILPSLERDVRRELTERAEAHAVTVFARNLRNLLLQPPVRDRRVLAVDPGYKSGCKLVAMDQFGNMLDHAVMYLVGKDGRREEATRKIVDLITRHELQVVVIGNGTACRETEDFIAAVITNELGGRGIGYVIVNEAGASVYSTSRIGREEFPQYDATLRGAISIGRRLQDPLSELVKIDAANIGVGLYQHDVKAKHLRASLDEVVESCVNYVGVDVNSASPALLRYVSGLNQLTARRVYEHRRQNGPFRNREQLKDVPGFGEATFVQAAGFLKIVGGDNPLDGSWIHPESYEVTRRALAKLNGTVEDLTNKEAAAGLADRAAKVDLGAMAGELEVGLLTLKDILAQLARPGRDPREDLSPPVFKQGILKLEDLTPGMELTGTVLNVVDFGAFVDIGVHHSGLIHVSQLADKYVRDPHEVVAVGDVVKVWVLEVDKQRRRVSLTMIKPGTQRPASHRPPAKPEEKPAGQEAPRRRPERRPPPRRPAPDRGGRSARPPAPSGPPKPPPKPKPKKPVVPLTDEMKTGKAPLRTFGDLMQFFELKHSPPQTGEEEKKPDKG
jgi:uncharacterized protein